MKMNFGVLWVICITVTSFNAQAARIPADKLPKYVQAIDFALQESFECEFVTYSAQSKDLKKHWNLVAGDLSDDLSQPVISLSWEDKADKKRAITYAYTTDSTFTKIIAINFKLYYTELTNVGTIIDPNFQNIPILKKELVCPL